MQQINKTVLYVQSAHPSSREGTKQQNDFQPPLTCRVLLPMLFMIQVIVLCTTLANIRRYKLSTPLYKTGNNKAFSSCDQRNKKVRYLVHILNVFPTFFLFFNPFHWFSIAFQDNIKAISSPILCIFKYIFHFIL